MLVEFWDFCRPQSIRTLPYIGRGTRAMARRLRVIGVHCPGSRLRETEAVRDAVAGSASTTRC